MSRRANHALTLSCCSPVSSFRFVLTLLHSRPLRNRITLSLIIIVPFQGVRKRGHFAVYVLTGGRVRTDDVICILNREGRRQNY